MVLKIAVMLESLWVWQLDKFHHIWEDKVLMYALKEVLQTTLIKTKLHIKLLTNPRWHKRWPSQC